jgi:DNA-binding CsgD family transcriptional regulator
MTAEEFNAAKACLGHLSNRQMAVALGLARNTVNRYASGDMQIPRCVELACAALVAGLAPVMPAGE